MKQTSGDSALERAVFRAWLSGRAETNHSTARRLMFLAMKEELTEIQRTYATEYYVKRLKMSEIAVKYGVNKASVSRAMARARAKLRKVLRYTSPDLLAMSTGVDINDKRAAETKPA